MHTHSRDCEHVSYFARVPHCHSAGGAAAASTAVIASGLYVHKAYRCAHSYLQLLLAAHSSLFVSNHAGRTHTVHSKRTPCMACLTVDCV